MKKLDDDLAAMVKNHDMYIKLTRPVCAFITFESDDGYNEALHYSKKGLFNALKGESTQTANILGRPVNFTAATEPTNIIWENRHIKGINLYTRIVVAVILITIMLSIAFTGILVSKKYAIRNSANFAKIDCEVYKNNLKEAQGFTDDKLFEQ